MNENNENKGFYSSLSPIGKVIPILLGAVALFIFICLISGGSGVIGGAVSGVLFGLFSLGAYVIPLAIAIHAICFAADLALGKIKSRIIFSLISLLSVSSIEYAVRFFEKELVFAPVEFYASKANGGFIGSVLGFAFGKLLGSIGVIILFVAIIAVFATFFYADKTGSFGKRVNAVKDGAKAVYADVKRKAQENAEKNRQIKEEEAQYQRELVSDELADDDFFKARGADSEVKVTQLGIDESLSPTGAATLIHHEEETPVYEETPVSEPIAEEKPRRTKPLDLNYGIEDTDITYRTSAEPGFDTREEKPAANSSYSDNFFGLDQRAEQVFTKSFEPFDFATSEKLAAKPSSRSIVQEELDDITVLEMKGEPTEREKRLMELERKKKLWLEQKERERKAKEAEAPVAPAVAEAPAVVEETPVKVSEPIATEIPITPAASAVETPITVSAPAEKPIPERVNTYTSYTTTETTYTAPIKTVEFTLTNNPQPDPYTSRPTTYTDTPAKEQSAEAVADLIAEKIARSNPAYMRSANEMKTYTTVISSGEDELYQPKPSDVVTSPSANEGYTLEFPETSAPINSEPRETYVFDEATKTAPEQHPYERAAEFTASEITFDEPYSAPTAPIAPVASAAFTAPTASETIVTPEPVAPAAPEFKPYSAPSLPTSDIKEDSSLTVEREMLAPEVAIPASDVSYVSFEESEETETPVIDSTAPEKAEENDFEWTAEEEEASATDSDETATFDIPEEEDAEEEIVEEITEEIEEEEETISEEIPPEKQNPDVIKMREMFPFLNPLDEQKPVKEQPIEEQPAVVEEEDAPPFDEPTVAKSAPIKENLAPVPAKPEPKKPDYSNYEFPSIELLAKEENTTDENIQSEIQENADKLIETLASFNVTASIKGVDRGPRITRYEVVPAKGVKVSSILNLQDDIALNLAAGSIRMEAPIPGKSAVGIEIPNKKSSTVRLRNLLETEEFQSNKSKTAVCIGRDVAGQPVFGDIAKMPHLLIAGATGMGKSVCINSLLISVLYKARPDEVKLIMIDPKQVEFTMYNGIPHLLVPVVSDAKQAAGALMWAVEEMERRYNLLNPLCVRNIDAYNEKVTADRSLGEPMPRIIIVIDEFADLMLQVKDPVETLVMRIAQKARAAGIYLVIGTQRPSVNVITGVIKANVPSRISCKVMSNVDSKTVLDSAGAEKLLDRGDMLYAPAGSPKPHRVQGAFVADGEVEAIMQHLKRFSDGASYDSTVMEEIERAAQKCSKKGGGSSDYDDGDGEVHGEGYLNDRQFLDAVEVAVNTRKISTSLIQRKLSIGYGKAAKFIDIMEDMGIVGEANGQRPREVLITPDEWREKLARATLD